MSKDMITRKLFASLAALVLTSCTTAAPSPRQESAETIGSSKAVSLEVCMPGGEAAYLARLRCSDGSAPKFARRGSVGPRTDYPKELPGESSDAYIQRISGSSAALRGAPLKPGEVDYHIVDVYSVTCGVEAPKAIFLDMYHCGSPASPAAPKGLSLAP